jgi:inner membrane protein
LKEEIVFSGIIHVIIGCLGMAIWATHFQMDPDPLIILGAAIGSLIPDMDHPQAMINQKLLFINRKWFKVFFYGFAGYLILLDMAHGQLGFILLGVFLILTGFSKHRGFTHRMYGAVFFALMTYIIGLQYNKEIFAFSIILGYFLHLAADELKTDIEQRA